MIKSLAILISLLVIVPFSISLGCIRGFSIHEDQVEPSETWIDLGSPPGKIQDLITADTSTIYVKTTDGKFYSCYHESQDDQDCWQEVNSIPSVWEDDPSCPLLDKMPKEPEDILERLDNRHCIDSPVYEGNHWFSYILLTNGKVMQWISEPIGW